jgi:transposase
MDLFSVKHEKTNKILEGFKPAIELITDNNIKMILNTLMDIVNEQQTIIKTQQSAIEEQKKEITALKTEIEELKEKLNTNSNNSSKPPSTDHHSNANKNNNKGNGKRGGQTGHQGITRNLLPENEVDIIEKHYPQNHCACGGAVTTQDEYKRHQVHDIPPVKTVVTEHQLHYGCCEDCGKQYVASLPNNIPTGMLGPYLLALIATLTSDYKMSKRDVARFLIDFYCLSISIATVKRAEKDVSEALKLPVEEAKTYVQEQEVKNCDETSHFECGKKMWAWVVIANTVAIFAIASSRSAKVAKALLGSAFKGILGSDRYSAYLWIAAHYRQVCWAHLKRDFTKISERTGKSRMIGLRLLVCVRRMFRYWHQVRDGTMTREEFKKLMIPIRQKIESLLLLGTFSGNSKTRGTCLEILKIKAALWTFIDKVGVEPTNNIAEQVLRKIVIWRKVCFGTWSANGTLYLERIMTVVATCRLQNRSVYGFIREAVQAHLNGKASPSLVPVSILPNQVVSVNLDIVEAIEA